MSTLFRKLWSFSGNGGDEPQRDALLGEALGALDPAGKTPGYWSGFRRAVLLAAAPELARRRHLAEVTVSDVVFSWARTLVPAAMVAAVAAILFVQRSETGPGPFPLLFIEEILWEGVDVTAGDPRVDLEMELSFAGEVF